MFILTEKTNRTSTMRQIRSNSYSRAMNSPIAISEVNIQPKTQTTKEKVEQQDVELRLDSVKPDKVMPPIQKESTNETKVIDHNLSAKCRPISLTINSVNESDSNCVNISQNNSEQQLISSQKQYEDFCDYCYLFMCFCCIHVCDR